MIKVWPSLTKNLVQAFNTMKPDNFFLKDPKRVNWLHANFPLGSIDAPMDQLTHPLGQLTRHEIRWVFFVLTQISPIKGFFIRNRNESSLF